MSVKMLCKAPFVLKQFAKKLSTENKLIKLTFNEKTGIATATLQRPRVNALNLEMLTELSNTLICLEKSKVRGLILTSVSQIDTKSRAL